MECCDDTSDMALALLHYPLVVAGLSEARYHFQGLARLPLYTGLSFSTQK